MKNIFQKFLSLLLIVIISFATSLEVLAQNNISSFWNISETLNPNSFSENTPKKAYATEEEMKQDYYIISEMDTPYGKIYYMKKKGEVSTRASFWDVVDIGMAISSWAKLFGEPSWENAWWAILDTASLLPAIPSLRYVKNADEAAKKIAEYAKRSQENAKRVMNSFRNGKEWIQKLFNVLFWIKKLVHFSVINIKRSQLERKFEHAAHLWLTNKTSLNWIKEPERTRLLTLYQNEIVNIIRYNQWIYEFSIRWLPTYTFIKNGKLVHLRRDNFEFLSAYPLKDGVRNALRYAPKVLSLNPLSVNPIR